jgi:hypothetical protein
MIPVRDKRCNSDWTGGMSLKRSQACRSQRKRYAACLTRIMANWYEKRVLGAIAGLPSSGTRRTIRHHFLELLY